MANNKRLFLSLSEEDVARLDVLRTELGMNRSQYIRYVLSGQKKKLVPSMQYKDAIGKLSSIDLSLRVIALNESLAEEDSCYLILPTWESRQNMNLILIGN